MTTVADNAFQPSRPVSGAETLEAIAKLESCGLPPRTNAEMTALTPQPAHALRMLLIPAFVILVVYGHLGWALIVFITAGITDGLDGLIARWSGQKTSLGAWLDPMADKLLLVTTFIVLTLPDLDLANRLPVWLTVLIISRDVGIVLTVAIVNLAIGPRTFRHIHLRQDRHGDLHRHRRGHHAVFNYLRYRSVVVDVFVYVACDHARVPSTTSSRDAHRRDVGAMIMTATDQTQDTMDTEKNVLVFLCVLGVLVLIRHAQTPEAGRDRNVRRHSSSISRRSRPRTRPPTS
jgi:phosphatidylglycerophosphate synthase